MKRNKKVKKQLRRKKIRKKPIENPKTKVLSDFDIISVHHVFSMIGANYLLSDYEGGIWQPLFDINSNMSIEEQQTKIVMKASDEKEGDGPEFGLEYLIPCAWVMMPSTVKKQIYDQLTLDFGVGFLNGEMNTEVWEFFNDFSALIKSGILQPNP